MFARDRLQVDFSFTAKKALAAKTSFLPPLVIALVIAYVWLKDSYSMGMKFFLYLFPYVFLFFSQDMMKEEVESGVLENILFLHGRFRGYLWTKNFCLFLFAAGVSLAAWMGLATYGLFIGGFSFPFLYSMGMGLIAGAYYVAFGGWLSFYFRGGSNVLIIILGQLSLFIYLLFSVTQRSAFIDHLTSGTFPDWGSRLKFSLFLGLFPNLLASENHFIYGFAVLVLACLFLALQRLKLRSLELKK